MEEDETEKINPNTEYEIFTQDIYQTLINAQGLKTIEVKHNVQIKGKATEHQIDVYWEYEIAETKHRVAIECKNYNSSVSIAKVRDFYGVLADTGNISGIIVTKVGFQKGAKDFAAYYGINLKELRQPIESDWDGKIKTIALEMNMVVPHIKQRNIDFDKEWIKSNLVAPEGGSFNFTLKGRADSILITDKDGNKINNFHELDQKIPHNWKAEVGLSHTYDFEDAYIDFEEYGKVKIKAIKYVYDVNVGKNKFVIDGTLTAKAILKDAFSGKILFFDKNGTVK